MARGTVVALLFGMTFVVSAIVVVIQMVGGDPKPATPSHAAANPAVIQVAGLAAPTDVDVNTDSMEVRYVYPRGELNFDAALAKFIEESGGALVRKAGDRALVADGPRHVWTLALRTDGPAREGSVAGIKLGRASRQNLQPTGEPRVDLSMKGGRT